MAKTKKRNMACAPFIHALRDAGWTMRYDSVAGGTRTVEFFKFYGQREVQVQLWEDGLHRATHMLYNDRAKRRGRMSTPPTVFRDGLAEMWAAVVRERIRTDHQTISATSTSKDGRG